MPTRSLVSLLLVTLLGTSAFANEGWWSDDWNYRKEITLDAGATGAALTSTLVEFPVVLRFSIANFTYFPEVQPGGADIRVVDANGQPLDFHIESWDSANMLASVWVEVPALTAGIAQPIYMYYGNEEAAAITGSGSTYGVDQALVAHFAAAAPGADATAFGNQLAVTVPSDPGSKFGDGVLLDGTGNVTVLPTPSVQLAPETGFTITAWVRPDVEQAAAVLLDLPSDQASGALRLVVDGSELTLRAGDASTAPAPIRPEWTHLAVAVEGESATLYINGVAVETLEGLQLPQFTRGLTLGAAADGSAPVVGIGLDELTVAKVRRSDEWISTLVDTQGLGPTLIRYGTSASSGEGGEGGEPNYFLITLENVTPDGWVVIVILAVMAVITWLVMAWKGITIGRTKSQNSAFLNHFYSLGPGDPARLDEQEQADEKRGEGHFEASSLYHIYHLGIDETKQRLAGASAGASRAKYLSAESVASIRASLDAKMVRETQTLNSLMVLLTLAIAGGPFLGLLGTVVGVMITFAAIAHEGNVDVNAIAPGIAAALAATVAGLAVAIPALFGYNWLSSQIKEITADMRVFLDEFITRLAEHYS
ncbi:MAG: DUF2341 domain-containing protein [Pseudomonadota bacterium]